MAGYLLAAAAVRSDRRASAAQGARLDSIRAQVLLERASAYVSGLAGQLASQPVAGTRQFSFVSGAMSASFGLVDVLWIPAGSRRLTVRYATTIAPGVSVTQWPALASTIGGQQVLFGVTATSLSRFGGQRGIFVVATARFGHGPASAGYLAVFVPRGWLALSLGDAPGQVAVSVGGRLLYGPRLSQPPGVARFEALGQDFQIGRPLPPATTLQSTLPWIALAWPVVFALIAALVSGAVAGRRRAERTVERVFDLSPDMLCVVGYDGSFKRINPAFEQALRFSANELLGRPFFDFVHPDDRDQTREAFARLERGELVVAFRNRYLAKDGSARWLEWNSRPVLRERLVYAAARDVTERHASSACTESRALSPSGCASSTCTRRPAHR